MPPARILVKAAPMFDPASLCAAETAAADAAACARVWGGAPAGAQRRAGRERVPQRTRVSSRLERRCRNQVRRYDRGKKGDICGRKSAPITRSVDALGREPAFGVE